MMDEGNFAPANDYSTLIYLGKFGPPLNETDDTLKHVCTKLLSTSTSIDPANIDSIFKNTCEDGLYDRDQSKWTDRSHYSEALLFLNLLTEQLYAALSATHASSRLPKRRSWIQHVAESSSEINHRLLLVNHDCQKVTAMDGVYAIAEIATHDLRQSGTPPLSPLVGYGPQFGLSIQKSIIHLVKYDRYGFMTVPIDIHRHPHTILSCISALATCDSYDSGFPHIDLDSIQSASNPFRWIKTTTHDEKAAYSRHGAEHRTSVRLTGPPVSGPFDESSSEHAGHDNSEVQFLDQLKDIQGVPKIAACRSMTVDNMIYSINPGIFGPPRSLTVESTVQTAEHLISINFFTSRQEFFNAIKTCIETHRDAYFSHKLLHNDINLVSIALKVEEPNDKNAIPFWHPDGTPPIRRAMLRGWRFAKHLDNPGTQLISLERLTYAEHFLATEILWHKGCAPRRRHDLESFLWVMLFVCINYVGPYGQRRVPPGGPEWLRPVRLCQHRLDICKERFRVGDWNSTCKAYFSPYFNHPAILDGLAHLASRLSPPGSLKIKPDGKESLSFPENPVTHDHVILVLKYIIAHLPVEEPPLEDVVKKAREAYTSRRKGLVSAEIPKIYD